MMRFRPLGHSLALAAVVTSQACAGPSDADATSLLSAEASDAVGVTRVRFEVDGQVVGEVLSAPYTLSWSPGDVADGSHEIRAFALDAAGNVGQAPGVVVLIDRTAPSLNVTASPSVVWPPNGKLVSIVVSVSVSNILDPNPRVFLGLCTRICNQASIHGLPGRVPRVASRGEAQGNGAPN